MITKMRLGGLLKLLAIHTLLSSTALVGHSEDEKHSDEVFEYEVESANFLTGEGVNIGGFLFPRLFVIGTGGVLEPGASATDLATAEHDPQREAGIQALEFCLGVNMNDVISGRITAVGIQQADQWETGLEEVNLRYHLSDNISVGGGQFLNRFGWQANRHLHGWDYVNQNLVNSRLINEGELITQGGEIIFSHPNEKTVLALGFGGVRTHVHAHDDDEHGHGHEHDDHDEDHEHEEEHHLEADDAGFNNWVATADLKWNLPGDGSATGSASFGVGENGFGETTYLYGLGFQKIWGAHDHGNGPEFCDNAWMLRSEFVAREVNAIDEGEEINFSDYGLSNSLFYGLSETATLSFRHDWVSGEEALELPDHHRFSPAFTTQLGNIDRVQMRLQYDYNRSTALPSEHVAWLQFQLQWGGEVGHHDH